MIRRRVSGQPDGCKVVGGLSCRLAGVGVLALGLLLTGCGPGGGREQRTAQESVAPGVAPSTNAPLIPERVSEASEPASATPTEAKPTWTEASLHAAFKAKNPDYNGAGQFQIEDGRVIAAALPGTPVTDLSPLEGEPLRGLDLSQTPVSDLSFIAGAPIVELYLEQTRVADISALKGMPLVQLYLSQTSVTDLSPLAGAPLDSLNMLGTPVTDLSPLKGMPLRMLWLNETPVSDISPLSGMPLESLTLHRTQVRDLSPLAGSGLQRLHIGETPVSDLTPLRGLHLSRLIFDPRKITEGLSVAREMATLQEMGLTFEEKMPPPSFWEMFPELKAE